MERRLLDVSLQGNNPHDVVQAIVDTWFADLGDPIELEVDHEETPVTPDWVSRWVVPGFRKITASYDRTYSTRISIEGDGMVKASRPQGLVIAEQVTADLSRIPFEVATFGSIYSDWYSWDNPYEGGSFYGGHYPLGWAAAFRGEGHRRLVSRRWLEGGPWRLLSGDGDVTLVQFHDLYATDAEARRQAAPGHQKLRYRADGGFIPYVPTYSHTLDGLYLPGVRKLKIVVHGRTVSEEEMLSACTARYFQALGPDKPLESIGYVFMIESDAKTYLPALWVRELECYCIRDGAEVRLDTTFQTPSS